MGLILDTTVLIDAERRGLNVDEMLVGLTGQSVDAPFLCAMSLMELAHGTVRLRTESGRRQAEVFLDDLLASVPVLPVTEEVAVRAGRLNATLRQSGVTIGVVDVVIAATALELGYGVLTFNVKHFQIVPGLQVVEL